MAIGQSTLLKQSLSSLWSAGVCAGLTDEQLLDRFLHSPGQAAEAAFEAIVARHGPMVLRVCRDLLADSNDSDDAFQATFLALVRSAASIRDRNSLASWLYGAARRVALRARADAARRRQIERLGARPAASDPGETGKEQVDPALLEEVDRLPFNFRAPIVLCYFEGSTHEGAARQLGWPVGTVRGRLARARDLLRARLTRRGLTVPSALIGAGLVASEARAALPVVLARATVQSALAITAHPAAEVSARVAAWTESGLPTASFVRWNVGVGLIVLLGAIGLGLVAIPGPTAAPGPEKAGRQDAPTRSAHVDQTAIQGTWSKMDGSTWFVGGIAQPPKRYKYIWSVSADTITTTDDEGFASEIYRYTLDPTATPKTIEMNSLNQGFTLHGIYRLEGDSLTVCFGHERPNEFKEGPAQILITLPRESRTPVKLNTEYPTAPGCYWAWAPAGDLPSSMANSSGISAIIKKDQKGALVVTLAAVSRIVAGKPDRQYRPVAFDRQKNRYLFGPDEGGLNSTVLREFALEHNEFRLQPGRLAYDQVDRLGIEVVPAEVLRAEREAASAVAMKKAREAGIEILPRPEVGKPFEFALPASDGKSLSSSGLKGKVVLIDCWATWCTPCMAKMPELKALHAQHHAAGLELIGVNFDHDQGRKNISAVVRKLGLTWPHFLVPDDEQQRNLWEEATGIDTLPRLLLIDRDGILRWDGGPDQFQEQVTKLFAATKR
jgi:RNA polymerase sigma factor (sigma-70 family)